ncbi:MAG: 2OG-Fe(II) oxygenase [Methylococcaceae bacterium]
MKNNATFPLDFINQIVSIEQLNKIAEENAEKYQQASPFPHIYFDDFFPKDFLAKVSEEFPEANSETWQKFDGKAEKKLASQGDADIGPYVRALISIMNSGMFIEFIEKLTGISGLLPDPHLTGGGMHQIMPGGKLSLHIDFNKYQRKNLERRLNILVYLNENWEESYGGYLELWNKDVTKAEVKILPVFNRVALFSTTETSWHGHPDPLTCPANRTRRSVALYYYTVKRPEEEQAEEHTTVFKERPGETLTEFKLDKQKLKDIVKDFIPPILLKMFK